MERLTARSVKNNMAYLVKVKPDEQEVESPYPNTLNAIIESFQRLAEYEDKIERGELVVLPHPIGCKVYHIETDGVLKGRIREVTVAGYSENKWQGRANSEKDHRFVIFHNSYNQPIACQLCNVYRTREEAEKALKGGAE